MGKCIDMILLAELLTTVSLATFQAAVPLSFTGIVSNLEATIEVALELGVRRQVSRCKVG